MKRILMVLAILSLSACQDYAQNVIDRPYMICRDNVEYMVITGLSGGGASDVVPHFKPDGTLFTCVRKADK